MLKRLLKLDRHFLVSVKWSVDSDGFSSNSSFYCKRPNGNYISHDYIKQSLIDKFGDVDNIVILNITEISKRDYLDFTKMFR